MSTKPPAEVEGTDLDNRTRRALTEVMTVLEVGGNIYEVVGENGTTYTVDHHAGRCTCPDHEHRNARCKHLRRVAFAIGERPVPAGVDVAEELGAHVDGEVRTVATDGGVVLDEEPADPWEGPFTEYDRYGHLTGHTYVRCRDCGLEVVTGRKDHARHADGCRFGA